MGGRSAGPVTLDEHDFALWEKRVDALMVLCQSKGHLTVDGLQTKSATTTSKLQDMRPIECDTL